MVRIDICWRCGADVPATHVGRLWNGLWLGACEGHVQEGWKHVRKLDESASTLKPCLNAGGGQKCSDPTHHGISGG